jgi:hypothetical protein
MGIDSLLGEDLARKIPLRTPNVEAGGVNVPVLSGTKIPDLPSTEIPITLPETKLDLPTVPLDNTIIPTEVSDVTQSLSEVSSEVEGVTGSVEEAGAYVEANPEALEKIAQEKVTEIDAFDELKQNHSMTPDQLQKYQKALEKYKNGKQIEAELLEKAKGMATDVVLKNQDVVKETVGKLAGVKRKFSDVPDVRKLPKRAPNPMKELTWRERLWPGLTFQLITGTETWLEFDPQVYYRLNGDISAGIGGMYRFTLDDKRYTVNNLGNMYGTKVFVQYHAFQEFFVRAEGQQVIWKPWDTRLIDPGYTDKLYVVAAGIGKSYMIARLVKGNMQVLYHKHWGGSDPYRPVIMMRIGFDLSLKKKEKKPWEEKLREIKKTEKKSMLDRNKSRLKYTDPKPKINVPKL